jgi:two-component system chemotaxis sensor kinase CheA
MSFDDDEILQDFLIEAGEIIELLSEQLVDLEQSPDDSDLLNAIFRGFHTIKGGAGFLQLTPLVDCCHIAENVFDLLRNGERGVDADLMDTILQTLDTVNEMFDAIKLGDAPEPAPQNLLDALNLLAVPASQTPAPVAPAPVVNEPLPESTTQETIVTSSTENQASVDSSAPLTAEQAADEFTSKSGDISDEEFEQLLNALDGQDTPSSETPSIEPTETEIPKTESNEPVATSNNNDFDFFDEAPVASASSNEITEDEFEALLDQLQSSGATITAPVEAVKQSNSTNSDEINDSEFEDLLNQLHGSGAIQGPSDAIDASSIKPPETVQASMMSPDIEEISVSENSSSTDADIVPVTASETLTASTENTPTESMGVTTPISDKEQIEPDISIKAPSENISKPEKPKRSEKEVSPSVAEATVRVDTKRLDDIMNMVGELVLVRNRLVRLGDKSSDEIMVKAVANLDVVTGDLQAAVMKTRMQPIKKVFGLFPRVVRDLARTLKKEVNLELQGEETDLDKNLVEALADPLVHLVRNSVDHGIETPDVREANGKPRVGTVVLAAEQEGDHILLIIEDDGAGMDAQVLRSKVVEKGLLDQDSAERLSDKDCYNLIFMPGFSTKEEISDVSGRGVGMDVVKTKINQLNGMIDIDSEKGRGTRITIKVPLTLAIMPTLMVMLQEQAFAFPLVSVNEIFHLDLTKTNIVDGKEVVVVREKAIPLFHLKRWLVNSVKNESPLASAHVVVVSVGTQRVGFVVDQLIGQEEVVIKPLGNMLQGTAGMAGATITGDGRIALILDVPSMLVRYA